MIPFVILYLLALAFPFGHPNKYSKATPSSIAAAIQEDSMENLYDNNSGELEPLGHVITVTTYVSLAISYLVGLLPHTEWLDSLYLRVSSHSLYNLWVHGSVSLWFLLSAALFFWMLALIPLWIVLSLFRILWSAI
jgi:hypothetical protein